MKGEAAYREACVEAEARRAQLKASARNAKARIAPARLKQDASAKITASVANGVAFAAAKVQQRPVAVGAAASALIIYLARRPLAALFGRLYVRLKNRNSENDDA